MSDVLFFVSLLFLFLAIGVSRSVLDGKKGKEGAKKEEREAGRNQLRLSWVLGAIGGALLIASWLT